MEKINFHNTETIKRIKAKWNHGSIDVIIVTFNRLTYLQKCINSLLAAESFYKKIIVHDDGSEDGTKEWLDNMLSRGKIDKVIYSNGIGTADAINKGIEESDSEIFLVTNDDMYFHRNWSYAVMNTFNEAPRCGLVTIYNFARLNFDDGVIKVNPDFWKIVRSGLGCTAIRKELYEIIGGFNLPKENRMGYFSSYFCQKANALSLKYKNNLHYITIPNFAIHMDSPKDRLCDRDILEDYSEFRGKHKKGKSEKSYIESFNLSKIKS